MTNTTYSPGLIDICPSCKTPLYVPSNFCTACGAGIAPPHTGPPQGGSPQHLAARGLAQMLGLHPLPSVLTLTANAMLFTGTVFTMGALVPLAIGTAAVLGYITYRSQIRFYGDDEDAAKIKALAVLLVTAIPVGLPAFLTPPSAVVGVVHTIRRKF